jgi:predicted RNase H-like HicB family nuclease
MAIRHYPALIYGEPGSYGVVFPDLPGCTSGGATLAEAARNAGDALSFHLEGMAAAAERIPEPGDFDAPLPDWLAPEEGDEVPAEPVRLLVPVEAPGRAVRVNISMDEGLIARLDAAAGRRGMSRSAFLAEAVRSALIAEKADA